MDDRLVQLLRDLQDVQCRANRRIMASDYTDREQYLLKLGVDLVIKMIAADEDGRCG